MSKYHTFLIEAYAGIDESGKPASFAEIGGLWGPQHSDWVATYSRIIERAVKLLAREDQFIRTIVYLPRWLIPDDSAGSAGCRRQVAGPHPFYRRAPGGLDCRAGATTRAGPMESRLPS